MLGSFLSPRNPTLLGLFSLLSGIQGDCGPPPKLSNAIPLNNAESFPPKESVTYRCLDDFYNVYGKGDVATCLSDSTWTSIEEFCERICPGPPRFRFAKIKDGVIETYHPAKTEVTYICRPGYDIIPGIDSVITCLDNYTWTVLPVFCEGKSCGDPGKPEHGEVVVLTNLLYLAKVNFICEEGYRLIGSPSTKCVLKGDRVEWQTKPPECQQIICFSPPNVTNASHNGNSTGNFTYNSTVTYHCDHGFLIIGEASIHCTTENNLTGVWRGSSPECKAITTPIPLTKRPSGKEDNFTAITTLTTSILLTKRPTEKEDNFTGLQLGDVIGIKEGEEGLARMHSGGILASSSSASQYQRKDIITQGKEWWKNSANGFIDGFFPAMRRDDSSAVRLWKRHNTAHVFSPLSYSTVAPVLVVLCTAVIVGSILWQKKKRSYDLNQEATKSVVL